MVNLFRKEPVLSVSLEMASGWYWDVIVAGRSILTRGLALASGNSCGSSYSSLNAWPIRI
jgi:hypothetical protein